MEQKRIAVVRIKGNVGLKKPVKDTFLMLRLYKKHSCVVIPNTKVCIGMLEKIQNAATWGEINEITFAELFKKRGRLAGKKPVTEAYLKEKLKITMEQFVKDFIAFKKELKDVPGLKPFFKLKPPRHGFEKKGIKVPYSLGGVLGYRKDKINDLLMRMM